MTQLSEEQQERVKQIRERQKWRAHASLQIGRTPDSTHTYADTDFLLSLLDSDSQAAEGDAISRSKVVARIERQIRLWNNDTVTMACADMLADIKQLPSIDPATAIRDKCVNKVREYLTDCRDEERGIIEAIAVELSSLTLDQVKPEKP